MAHEEQRLIMKYVDEPGYTNDIDCYINHGGYDDLKKVARKTGMHTELDHGKLLVARGITSVEELQRSLKK